MNIADYDRTIETIERTQDEITAIQSGGYHLGHEMNQLLDMLWVTLQQNLELAQAQRALLMYGG